MVQVGTWRSWPAATHYREYYRKCSIGIFSGLSLKNYVSLEWQRFDTLATQSICFALTARWLRYKLSQPWQKPLERIKQLEDNFDGAAAGQLLYLEMLEPYIGLSMDDMPSAEIYSAATKVSGLKFTQPVDFRCQSAGDSNIHLARTAQKNRCYLLKQFYRGENATHTCAMHYRPTQTTQFFDPNIGEFDTGREQFGQFWGDYCNHLAGNSQEIEHIFLYSVEYTPPGTICSASD